jgi:hypothetical protein
MMMMIKIVSSRTVWILELLILNLPESHFAVLRSQDECGVFEKRHQTEFAQAHTPQTTYMHPVAPPTILDATALLNDSFANWSKSRYTVAVVSAHQLREMKIEDDHGVNKRTSPHMTGSIAPLLVQGQSDDVLSQAG